MTKKKGIKEKGLENYYSVDETAFAWECIFSLKAGKQKQMYSQYKAG